MGEEAKNPNEALAAMVVAKLREQGLVEAEREEEILQKVAAGTAQSEDWNLWIELAQAKQNQDENNGSD